MSIQYQHLEIKTTNDPFLRTTLLDRIFCCLHRPHQGDNASSQRASLVMVKQSHFTILKHHGGCLRCLWQNHPTWKNHRHQRRDKLMRFHHDLLSCIIDGLPAQMFLWRQQSHLFLHCETSKLRSPRWNPPGSSEIWLHSHLASRLARSCFKNMDTWFPSGSPQGLCFQAVGELLHPSPWKRRRFLLHPRNLRRLKRRRLSFTRGTSDARSVGGYPSSGNANVDDSSGRAKCVQGPRHRRRTTSEERWEPPTFPGSRMARTRPGRRPPTRLG